MEVMFKELQEQNRQLTLLVANVSAQLASLQSAAGKTPEPGQPPLSSKKGPNKVQQRVQTLNAKVAASSHTAPSASATGLKRSTTVSVSQVQTPTAPGVSGLEPGFVSNGWTTKTKSGKPKVQKETKPDVMDSLWNVPQMRFEQLDAITPGVAFATPEETRQALQRPKASVPQAVLCSKDINEMGVGLDVPVTDSHGKPDSRYRYLFQVGTGEVSCDKSSFQVGGAFATKTVRAVVTVDKGHVKNATWERCIQMDPENAVREWIGQQKIKALEVQRPSLYVRGAMRMVVRLSSANANLLMRACGVDGILTGTFVETDEDKRKFATIPLDVTREKAMERASFHGLECWGVVPQRNGQGWGIRVLASEYERLAKLFRPNDYQKITGDTYEISGLPVWMGEEGLTEFLAPGTRMVQVCRTETRGRGPQARRSFSVNTDEQILWTRKQGEDF